MVPRSRGYIIALGVHYARAPLSMGFQERPGEMDRGNPWQQEQELFQP